jgi:chaperonin GroEL
MVYRPNVDTHLAFVLMPFKPPFDSYYEGILKPAAKMAGLEARRADEIYGTGPIIQDIWKQIWGAAVVIADVTGKNPNVNYELGICHTLGVPTVIITQSFDDVPFDYRHRRCIEYDTEGVDWQRVLKKNIVATLKHVLAGEDITPELGWPYDTAAPQKNQKDGTLVPANDARGAVIRGVRIVRDAIAYAFGPQGTHVSMRTADGQQKYYKRGTAIASSIRSADRLEEVGILHASDLAREMRDRFGDGSKTATLMFAKMLDLANHDLDLNHPRSEILKGMERATEAVVSAIRGQSTPATQEILIHVARTAAGGDPRIGAVVVEAFKKAGRDGLIGISSSNNGDISLEAQEGMYFDRGYIDSAMISSTEQQECVLENAYILVYDQKISSIRDLMHLLEEIVKSARPLLIIADDVEGEALATISLNRKRGTLNCLAVRAPGYADTRRALLEDIAVLTGATEISLFRSGRTLASVTLRDLGQARKITVTRDSTSIIGGAGESALHSRVEALREELARTTNPYAVEKLRERLAKLSGAIVSIRIGSVSGQSQSDATYHAESAMHSVQKAIEEGSVLGGGLTLLRASAALSQLSFKKAGEVAGVDIVARALEEPAKQLLVNGKVEPESALEKIKKLRAPKVGFNAQAGKLQDLSVAGVWDPVATVTCAVRLAYAHAKTILETGAWDPGPRVVPNETDSPPERAESQSAKEGKE